MVFQFALAPILSGLASLATAGAGVAGITSSVKSAQEADAKREALRTQMLRRARRGGVTLAMVKVNKRKKKQLHKYKTDYGHRAYMQALQARASSCGC